MRLPFVSRERYNELRDAHTDLLEQYHRLLAEREKPSPEPKPYPRPAAPSAWARDPMIERMAADLEATMGDPLKARAEAERLKREAFGGSL